mmetsp:Transcript_74982/g.160562  ORF Transcript_74982/g.160562 Transcript_74982/m.160562 type:complete len:320 (+) Transcript_74982:67-1026(+)
MRFAVLARSLIASCLVLGAAVPLRSRGGGLRLLRHANAASAARDSNLDRIGRADLTALYINVRERPQRRLFAEAQYRALGLKAKRIEGTSSPTRVLGLDHAWIQAASECANMTGPEKFCLIAEDDAVYRPVDQKEAELIDEKGWPKWGTANTTAEPLRFFAELADAVAAMPGGIHGSWAGLHLCTLGMRESLMYDDEQPVVAGGPWPEERFSMHALYPGAPGVLLLRREQARSYATKLQARLVAALANHTEPPSDVLQSQLYSAEDAAAESGSSDTLRVFVAENPQLCQHLTDLSQDFALRSSIEASPPSAREPGSYQE